MRTATTLKRFGWTAAAVVVSFFIWNAAMVELCSATTLWRTIDSLTRNTCEYSALPSLFSLDRRTQGGFVVIGDRDFIELVSSELGDDVPITAIDTCLHDLRDVQNVLAQARNRISPTRHIVIQTSPQLWTRPGFYGKPLNVRAFTLLQQRNGINKQALGYCVAGIETAIQGDSGTNAAHERPRIEGRAFSMREDYLPRLTKTLGPLKDRVVWLNDERESGVNPEYQARYAALLAAWPETLGTLALSPTDVRHSIQ